MPAKQHESKPSRSDKLFDGKLDDIVAKAIPAKWLPMSFVIAGVVAFLFLILTFIGFLRSPDLEQAAKDRIAKVEKDRDGAKDDLKKEREDHSETRKERNKFQTDAKRFTKAEKDQKDAEEKYANIKKELGTLRDKHDDLEKRLKSADKDKDREVGRIQRELSASQKKAKGLNQEVSDLKTKIDNYDTTIENLESNKEKEAQDKAVYDEIIETANRVEDLGKRLETLRTLRDKHGPKFIVADYAKRLDKEIARVEDERKDRAKDVYRSVERKLKMSKGMYDRQLEILQQAAEDLAETVYEDDIDAKIKKAKAAQEKAAAGDKTKRAKATYDAVMKRIKETPTAYEENLQALKDAAQQTEGTKYAATLNKYVAARERDLAVNIAEAAYDDLRARIKKNPKDFDGNITEAERALARAKATKYEKKVQGILDDQKADRIYTIGRDAYEQAKNKVKNSTDRDENIAALEELKATAAGSKYEASIEKLLAKQRKYKDQGK